MLDRVNKAFSSRIRKIVQTIGEASLTAAATTQTIDASKVLPPGAQLLGVNLRAYTPFTGGSISAMTLKIGTTGDDDSLVATSNLFAAAVDGQVSALTLGIAPFKRYAAATTLKLLFTATGDNVVNATAGAVTVEILYSVPDEN